MAKTRTVNPTRTVTRPLAIHKNYLIRALTEYPEKIGTFLPGYKKTAEVAIEELRAAKEEWFVGDEFITNEELDARLKGSDA